MYYDEILESILKDLKNPVNSMYLHEIKIKWKNFQKKTKDPHKVSNEILTGSLNEFINALSNKKYKYNSSTKNGFKPDSPIFSARYLDELLTILVKRTKIIDNIGITWGYQSFSTNLKFNPQNLYVMGENPLFEQIYSKEILHLAQRMDFQFRITGKRIFKKFQIILPLLLFYTFKNLTEKDFITIEYYTKMAKSTFEKSKAIIITETLDDDFVPDLGNSPLDAIFILRKQFNSELGNEISLDVVNLLEEKIKEYLTERDEGTKEFLNTGIIE